VAGPALATGDNQFGQLGDGTTTDRTSPVAVLNLNDIVAVAAGGHHSLAVLHDGTVWAWGRNGFGQLGDGTNTNKKSPVQVVGLSGIVAVAAGSGHSMALKYDGTVWAWGYNNHGQLGDGTTTASYTPVRVSGLANIVAIAAGSDHCVALDWNGAVWAWGYNADGQVGDGSTTDRHLPTQTIGITDVRAIAAGTNHTLAAKSDGTVWAWGYNNYGQLGDGTTANRTTPTQVSGLTHCTAVAGGLYHSVALRSDGTMRAWGYNGFGQLGDGTTTNRRTPVVVTGITDVTAIAAGQYHSLAIRSDTTAWAWGQNSYGQLGDGTTTSRKNPAQVPGLTEIVSIEGGNQHTLMAQRLRTSLYVPDRSGTITETVILRGFLKRLSDNAWLDGKTVVFAIDGTEVGSAVTGATGSSGRADLNYVIPEGPATRQIAAAFAGDGQYLPSSGTATLTCITWTTKMAVMDRSVTIGGVTELKARLVRSDNVPLYNRSIEFYVDGTYVITRPTDVQGYASYPYYHVPDEAGAGTRTILAVWPGTAGYLYCSRSAALTVRKATPYIFVIPRSVPQGGIARFYAYFRRLPDYVKQEGKTVSFFVDGTWITDVVTGTGDNAGIARYQYTTVEAPGAHVLRCQFNGDAWVDAGSGEATLTIY
jgi:alpha-tubulin suppressor-like RCC1 family protein